MKKRLVLGFSAFALSFALAACGSGSSKSESAAGAPAAEDWAVTEEAAAEEGLMEYYAEEPMESEMDGGSEAPEVNDSAVSERKLIKTVDLSVETKEYDALMGSLEKQVEGLGGYIEALDAYNGSYYGGHDNRSASITARIPVEKLDGFITQIGEEANIVNRNESVEDVTLQYVDLDSHARMLEEEQERLLELLAQAETIEDIIAIESRLSEVKYQLESMRSQLRTYDNKVQYSTVYIYIEEVKELTPVVELSAGERITQGFMDSIEDIIYGIKEFCIAFIINIPYIIVWAVIIAVLAFVVIKIIRFADKRSARLFEEAKKQKEILVSKKTAQASEDGKTPYVKRPSVKDKGNKIPDTDTAQADRTE